MLLNNDIAQSILNRIVLLLNILRKHIPISTNLTVLPSGRIVNNNKISILKLLSFSRSYHSSANLHQKRLTNLERSKFTLSDYLKAVLVLNILGDVYMRRFSTKTNTRIVFRQGSINAAYLLHLYSLFQQFVQTPPSITTIEDTKTGKTRQNISFRRHISSTLFGTGCRVLAPDYCLPAALAPEKEAWLPKLFQQMAPANYITPVSLAYWRRRLPDDGGCQSTRSGWRQIMAPKPNAFTKDELNLAPS